MKDVRIDGQTGLPDLEPCYDGLLEYHCQNLNTALPWKLMKAQMKQESRFNPLAVSPTGPVGLFQFTAATWKEWSQPGDDRRDIFKAVGAAVRYMSTLCSWATHRSVSGEQVYRFALGAYNTGMGNIGKAMRQASVDAADPLEWGNIPTALLKVGVGPEKIAEVTTYVNRIMESWQAYQAEG